MCEQELSQCHQMLVETKKMHAIETEALAAAEEKIQKLERRLIFVARVGNITLYSYASYIL